jgi:hypothetical protein
MERISAERFEHARRAYTLFAINAAHKLAHEVGFGYEAVAVDPGFMNVRERYEASMATRKPFAVWAGASDHSVFTLREGNWAFRFWRDVVSHGSHGLGFNLADELKAGMQWVHKVAEHFGSLSVEAMMAYADTCGQSLFAASQVDGQFPEDQVAFVRHYLCVDADNSMACVLDSYRPARS